MHGHVRVQAERLRACVPKEVRTAALRCAALAELWVRGSDDGVSLTLEGCSALSPWEVVGGTCHRVSEAPRVVPITTTHSSLHGRTDFYTVTFSFSKSLLTSAWVFLLS